MVDAMEKTRSLKTYAVFDYISISEIHKYEDLQAR